MSRRTIRDRKIWITGASSGIGEALALACAASGARLLLTARREDQLSQIARRCREHGAEQVEILPADLTDSDGYTELAERAWQALGGLDSVVHNAGVSQRSTAAETSPQVLDQIMNLNFSAPANLTRLLLPRLRQQADPQVVVIASVTAYVSTPLRSGYAASKHAVRAYFDALRAEEHAQGVGVTVVNPGFVRTAISENSLTGDGSLWGRLDSGQAKGIPADRCAQKILSAMRRGRREVVIARGERVGLWLQRFAPGLFSLLIRNIKTV